MKTIEINPLAKQVMSRLSNEGCASYLAGGSVRDAVMGRESKDIDIVTDALPSVVQELFPHNVPDGIEQGVIKAIMEDNVVVDIATMRMDGNYSDGRRPDQVIFTKDITEDVKRRDFTVNGLLADINGSVIDYVGGIADIEARVIRAIGDPVVRFEEDHLRMLRAIRFATCLSFAIEPETEKAIAGNSDWLANVSAERIWSELWRILGSGRARYGIDKLIYTNLMEFIFPEVLNCHAIEQDTVHHPEGNVLRHTLNVVSEIKESGASTVAILSGLLHDIGKAKTSTVRIKNGAPRISHIGHEDLGAEMAEQALRRLTCPTEIRNKVVWLVKNHMRAHKVREMKRSKLVAFLREAKDNDCLDDLVALQHADSLSSGYSDKSCRDFFLATPVTDSVIFSPLLINGNDLIALGLPQGKRVGEILKQVREQQDEGIIKDRENAIVWAKHLINL